jgi:hypothetical protein
VCDHSLSHERVIFCHFFAFFAALRAVGPALDKFKVGIRITEHKTGEINGKIVQYLAELVFWLSC